MIYFIMEYITTTSLLVGISAGMLVYWLLKKKYNLPPGPFALPLIGNYKLLRVKFVHKEIEKYVKTYGPVITIHMGPVRMVVLNSLESINEALIKRGSDFANRVHMTKGDVISEGCKDIAMADYTPTWKFHRKIVSKAFRSYLKGDNLDKAIQGSLKKVVKCIKEKKGPFNPKQYIDLAVFNIMCSLCFNTNYDLDDEEFLNTSKCFDDLNTAAGMGVFEDMFPYLKNIWPSKRFKRVLNVIGRFFAYLNKNIAKHREVFDSNNVIDFCDHLLNEKTVAEEEDGKNAEKITDVHVRQTIFDVFIAGIETSRFTLYWSLLYLAAHPNIQHRCQEEIDKVIGDGRLPGILDKEHLPYIEATLHEIMRVRTVVPVGLPHAARVDSTIGGYDIPKGTMVIMNLIALHTDPEKWKDPETFDPTRFLDNDGNMAPKPDNWLPFSAGRRVCLGEIIAKPELVTIIATFLQQFNMKIPEGTTPDLSMSGNSLGIFPNQYEIVMEARI